MAASGISHQSSVATIVEDLVSDRNIPLKIIMIILNCLQILSSWIAVIFYISAFNEWTAMEVGVSGSFLIVGNYIIPGITNGVIYWRRWNRSTIANRRRMEEENKQAWVCLRIALSLLGIPTVGRYIETIMVSRKLDELEKKHMHTSINTHREGSQLNPVGTSKLGSIINQKNYQKMSKLGTNPSVVSGASNAYTVNGMNETSQEKVRRARRQYKRCEHDGGQMALVAGTVGAGPLAVAFAVLYLQRIEKINMPVSQGAVVIAACVLNVLWLSATLTHFYPARHVQSEAEFERGVGASHLGSMILLYLSHLIQVVLRIICFAIFANWFYAYVLIFVVFHWLVGSIILIAYKFSMKSKTVGHSMISCSAFLSCIFLGYVGIFDFVNGNEGKTRLRYLIYYTFYYIENIIMLVIWIILNPITQIQFPIPFICVVLGLFWLGFILLQIYLYYYSYSPEGSSICGCCGKKTSRRKSIHYVEEVREPVFGVPLQQSAVPLWQNQQQQGDIAGSRISGINNQNYKYPKSIPLEHAHTPSIMSMPSGKSPQSILSQTSPYANLKVEIPKVHASRKDPPVIEQKTKKQNSKPVSKRELSSDSSSSPDEDFHKFNPKPLKDSQSIPNLANSMLTDSSSDLPSKSQVTTSTDIKGQFKAAPVIAPRSPIASKSLDNLSYIVPSIEPNSRTRPIGVAARLPSNKNTNRNRSHNRTEKSRNPYQKRNPNSLQPSAIRKIR